MFKCQPTKENLAFLPDNKLANNCLSFHAPCKTFVRKLYQRLTLGFCFGIFLALSQNVLSAGLSPQDAQLRANLQALADANHIRILSTTYPLHWDAIAKGLNQITHPEQLPAHLLLAYQQLKKALEAHQQTVSIKTRLHTASASPTLSHFGLHESAQDKMMIGVKVNQRIIETQLQVQTVNHPIDQQLYQLDGSYVVGSLNQWGFGFGLIDRWWGPSWQNSLILSHNARPIPMIFIHRQHQSPPEHAWLSWVGPWEMITFMGELESNRYIPETKLWGLRVSFSPHPQWEIGLSRVAQWSGEGRPKGWSVFSDLLLGQDNFESDEAGKLSEPGNQLAGIDLRFAKPLGKGSIASFVQVIGEDEAGNLPSRPMLLAGISSTIDYRGAPLTTIIEYQNTSLDSYSTPIYNSAYNHGIYQTGYRYRGRSIGSSFDNDTETLSWGALFQSSEHWHHTLWLTHVNANKDNVGGLNPVSEKQLKTTYFSVQGTFTKNHHQLTIGSDWWAQLPINALNRKRLGRVFLDYQWQLNL